MALRRILQGQGHQEQQQGDSLCGSSGTCGGDELSWLSLLKWMVILALVAKTVLFPPRGLNDFLAVSPAVAEQTAAVESGYRKKIITNYTPSTIETYFLDHAVELGFDKTNPLPKGCTAWTEASNPLFSQLTTFRAELEDYQRRFQAFQGRPGRWDLRDHIVANKNYSICDTLEFHPQGLAGIFPSGALSKNKYGDLLEPLYPPLRSPNFCFSRNGLMSLDYLVHDFAAYCRRLKPHSRIVLVDMGAALDFHGAQESPAIYLTATFQRFGFHFDHIYAYEIAGKDPAQVFERVPDELLEAYHWMNVGVSAEKDAKLNPWKRLLKGFGKDDLVIVKLDIDTPDIENPLAQQLLDTPELHELVDIFYFEHHVFLGELAGSWGSSMRGTVQESLQLFHSIRKAGIDAHSWP